MEKLAIIGSGDLGQLIAYHASVNSNYKVVGFFDDYKIQGTIVNGSPILGKTSDIESTFKTKVFDLIMIAIGYKHFIHRKAFFDKFKSKIPFATIIHPSCSISASCSIGEGTFILPGCILDRNVIIEENVLINTGCVIAHDSHVKQHTFLSPAVAIAGFSKIGSCCNIGINSTIIDNIDICNNVQTGGGTVVIKDIIQEGLYVGNPARFIK